MDIVKNYSGNVIFVIYDINEVYRVCDDIIVYENGIVLKKRDKRDLFNYFQIFFEVILIGCKNILKVKKIGKYIIYVENWGYKYIVNIEVKKDIEYICIWVYNIEVCIYNNVINIFFYIIDNIVENLFEFIIYLKNNINFFVNLVEFKIEKKNMNFLLNDIVYLKFLLDYLVYFQINK